MGILQLNYIFFKEKGNLVVYGESHNPNTAIANCFQSYEEPTIPWIILLVPMFQKFFYKVSLRKLVYRPRNIFTWERFNEQLST